MEHYTALGIMGGMVECCHLRKGLSMRWKGWVKETAPATQAVTNTPAPNSEPNTRPGWPCR